MFDLEVNINSWCDYLRSKGKLDENEVKELESHLREQIDEFIEKGLAEDEAFLIGTKRLGNVNAISKEFSKVNTEKLWKNLFLDSADNAEKKRNLRDILLVIIFSLLAGTIAKFSNVLEFLHTGEVGYVKNLSFYILPFIIIFFVIKQSISKVMLGVIAGVFIVTGILVNIYPSYYYTESLIALHLPIMLWLVTGVAYTGKMWKESKERMNFIRFTGESIIYGSLVILGLFVLSAFIEIIFFAISISTNLFIFNYVSVYGGCATAFIAIYLVENKKSVVENFAPILAKIFSPLFLITLIIFLLAMIITGASPFINRDFLIGFDIMLVLVLGMVLYTISAKNIHEKSGIFDYLNVALIIAAIIVDCVALLAIASRLSEYGVSPNKLAALGQNIVMLFNLIGLLGLYFGHFIKKLKFNAIEKFQTSYLWVYFAWISFVVLVFPIIFEFK